jgi:predicted DsbA family dithiol-disulfide isomerase
MEKLKVEIWSDVQCPFCYIGKHKFEAALNNFKNKDAVEVVWKSFQLNPNLVTDTNLSTSQYLAKHKGISIAEAQKMGNYVAEAGAKIGLDFQFDSAVVANTFNAHQILHFAEKKGLQNELKEALFIAHFTEGKNIDDANILALIAEKVGLDKADILETLSKNTFKEAVKFDFQEARLFGIQGVPFFVFNRKYAISGAQESNAFLETLEKSFSEWHNEKPKIDLEITQGDSCAIDGNC